MEVQKQQQIKNISYEHLIKDPFLLYIFWFIRFVINNSKTIQPYSITIRSFPSIHSSVRTIPTYLRYYNVYFSNIWFLKLAHLFWKQGFMRVAAHKDEQTSCARLSPLRRRSRAYSLRNFRILHDTVGCLPSQHI